jgi:hypothetical protein
MRLKLLFAFCSIGCLVAVGQDAATQPKKTDKTVAKPMTEKQKRQQQERLRKELETPYISG